MATWWDGPGRRIVHERLPELIDRYAIDFVVANGENAAGGNGLTHEVADQLWADGIDVLTSGNHIFDKREVLDFIDDSEQVVRPLNYPTGVPGRGLTVRTARNGERVAVLNVSGRSFMPAQYEDPFTAVDEALTSLEPVDALLVDMHAETTSEKMALGWYLDGRASVVVGTHTHVQTADERILPRGTGFLTDLGMTGPYNSVLGVRTELVLEKLRRQMPVRFETANGPAQLCGLMATVKGGLSTELERLFIRES